MYVLCAVISPINMLCAMDAVGPVDDGGLYRTRSSNIVLNRAFSIRERAVKEQEQYTKAVAEESAQEHGRLKFSSKLPDVVLYAEDSTKKKSKPVPKSNTLKKPRPPVVSYDLERITGSQAYQDFVGAIEQVQAELMDITQAVVPTKTRSQKRKFTDLISNDDLIEISADDLFKAIELICTNREGHRIGKGRFRSVMSAQKKMVIDMFDAYKIKLKEGWDTRQNQGHFDRYDRLKDEFSGAIDTFILSGSF